MDHGESAVFFGTVAIKDLSIVPKNAAETQALDDVAILTNDLNAAAPGGYLKRVK